jgi:hypothetical protein
LAKRFQRKRFLEIDQSETKIACDGHVCTWIGTKLALFISVLHFCSVIGGCFLLLTFIVCFHFFAVALKYA